MTSSKNFVPLSVMTKFSLGLVGSSAPAPGAYAVVRSVVSDYLTKFGDGLVVVSGGAKGVDSMAVKVCGELGVKVVEFKNTVYRWEGPGGFKERDLKIANESDCVVSIVNKSFNPKSKSTVCYHCAKVPRDSNHIVSGGCYTALHCRRSEVIVI